MAQIQRIPASLLSPGDLTPEGNTVQARNDRAWCADALRIQDASNLSGIAHSMAAMMSSMVAAGLDTQQRTNHPATLLFAAKIADLAGLDYRWPANASLECHRRSGRGDDTPESDVAA